MKTQANRARQLEQKALPKERQFVCWEGNSWTQEQAAEAIRRNPERLVFWRSLLETTEDT